jgi:hypothetical protein
MMTVKASLSSTKCSHPLHKKSTNNKPIDTSIRKQQTMMNHLRAALFLCLPLLSLAQEEETCDPAWKDIQEEVKQQRKAWKRSNTDCYSMTIRRSCLCPADLAVIKVVVKDGIVVTSSPFSYSMDDIFNLVKTQCLEGCPASGASTCMIGYGVAGDNVAIINSVYIDPLDYIQDDEIHFTVEDFEFTCGDEDEEKVASEQKLRRKKSKKGKKIKRGGKV